MNRLRALVLTAFMIGGTASIAAVTGQDETPTLNDMSPAGVLAAIHNGADPQTFNAVLPAGAAEVLRSFLTETRQLGLTKRTSAFFLPGPTNVQANNNAGDRIGETQAEVAVAVNGDTVVVGWNDSFGFTAGAGTGSPGPPTLTSFAYSTNGGASFTDGGSVPLAAAGDQAFGDAGLDTDERGNWYLNSIYTRTGPQQDIGVHHGRFNGAGVLVWDLPTMASIGTSATGNLDKCLLGVDRVTGSVYVAYTRFTATPQIEIVRSTTLGATWGAPIVLDNTTLPTGSKQAARPFCGPNGEVYVVWEKGANTINCPDGLGNVGNPQGQIAFTRSLNFGASYDPFTIIGNVDLTFMASGPGDLRERGNEFPDIAVDMTDACYRGNIYVTWHEAGTWTSNLAAGSARAEAADAANNNPGGAESFLLGEDVTGTISTTADFDYWTFTANQGDNLFFNLDPGTFNCGVSGTAVGMRMRLFAATSPFPNPTGFPDSLLAASAQGTFADRIVWTCPKTGSYVIRLQRSSGTTPFTYRLRMRPLTFTAASPARDARDITMVHSSNQGLTWSAEQRVNDDPAGLENRRPFIAVNSAGQVSAYWHDSRDAGLGSTASLTSVYGTVSRDGGATWSPNFAVTDEQSFFSFNDIGIPNLGDYNQAAAGRTTAVFHPAWSDQRISTGDVRTPGTNTFTAGRGPETYTTRISFYHSVVCPLDTVGAPGATVVRHFRIQNAGTTPDIYNYAVTDLSGWIVGVASGSTGTLAPGGFFDVFVQVLIPLNCNPVVDVLTLSALPVGDACHVPQTCQTNVSCEFATPTLVQRFEASATSGGVNIDWASDAVGQFSGWNLYRSAAESGEFVKLNAEPIAMGPGGNFHFTDTTPASGMVYYRLAAVSANGSERVLETRAVTALSAPAKLSLAVAGSNPFTSRTALKYALPQRGRVTVLVYSVAGQRVRTLVNEIQDAGIYTVSLDRRDAGGRALSPGIYLVRVSAGAESGTVRLIAVD